MAGLLIRTGIFCAGICLAGCASSSVPKNFVYETSVRGEANWVGVFGRAKASEALLAPGVVTDPAAVLRTALPGAEVKLRRWGLRYFDSNWRRYRVILDADIERDSKTIKCRFVDPEAAADAPLLRELTEQNGASLQARLSALTQLCIDQVLNPISP